MKILIFGAGSIGVYLGTLLSSKGHDVELLGRNKLKKLHETIMIGDSFYKLPKRIYAIPKNTNYDIIFITSKLYDLEKNLKLVINNKLKSKFLVSIQNGIVEHSLYESFVKNFQFTTISVFEGFRLVENQLTISPSKTGWKTDNSSVGKYVCNLLAASGINCSIDSDLDRIKAEKTVMNCSINLLSAIERKTFFELCHNKDTLMLIDMLFDESYTALSKLVTMRSKDKLKKLFYETVSNMRHYSSTYQDAISKRKSEIEFLNGLIIKLGKKYSLDTTENIKIVRKFIKMYGKSM